MNTLFATKKNMSQVFTTDGVRLPVTMLSSGPHTVTQVKTQDKDGYWAIQLGFRTRKIKNVTKPVIGHLKKALGNKAESLKFLREVRVDGSETVEVGSLINPSDVLEVGDLIKITGISKGKGFAGGVKRHGFAGGPKTHGQSDRHRAPGSIGQGTTPGRVYKGKRMAGRMGGGQSTALNLVVLSVDPTSGEVLVSGPVPGSLGTLLKITKVGKSKKEYKLIGQGKPEEAVETQEEAKEENGGKE